MVDTAIAWRQYVEGLDLSTLMDSDRAALENEIRGSIDGKAYYKREYFRKRAKDINKGAALAESQASKYPTIAPSATNPFSRGSRTAEQYETGVMLRAKAVNLHKLADIYTEVAKRLPRR